MVSHSKVSWQLYSPCCMFWCHWICGKNAKFHQLNPSLSSTCPWPSSAACQHAPTLAHSLQSPFPQEHALSSVVSWHQSANQTKSNKILGRTRNSAGNVFFWQEINDFSRKSILSCEFYLIIFLLLKFFWWQEYFSCDGKILPANKTIFLWQEQWIYAWNRKLFASMSY